MINFFYCRADLDKDGFLFSRLGEKLADTERNKANRIFLVVPDQYTLQAERNAFRYLNVQGLMELEILSLGRLGEKTLDWTAGSDRKPVDKYGRHMLLARIIADEEVNFIAFGGMGKKHAFISMVNDLISEFKQFNARPEDIENILTGLDQNSILRRKLTDIGRIYARYEEMIRDQYLDTEDHLDLVISMIKKSPQIAAADIWIDGFDYFTPKTMLIIEQLMRSAANMNIIMTYDSAETEVGRQNGEACGESRCVSPRDADLFGLPGRMLDRFRQMAANAGLKFVENRIDSGKVARTDDEREPKGQMLRHLERELYAYPFKRYEGYGESQEIELCRCGNFYTEAETAAVRISELVRIRNMRYRDILVICNDMDNRGSIIRRVFEEHGIPCFIDQKRAIVHHPCVEFILALLDIIGKGWRFEDVFRLLKTGLTGIATEDCEDLENYAYRFKVRGNRWKARFSRGIGDYGEEGLQKLNDIREMLSELISDFETDFGKAKNAEAKTILLYDFLHDKVRLQEHAESLTGFLRSINRHEHAQETSQIWSVIVNIMDQIVELVGNDQMSDESYTSMLRTGFEAIEIGLLPPTIDQVLVGTMQRTRPGAVKAILVIGANDGILPAAALSDGILNEDEKAQLVGKSIEICKHDDLRGREEKLAIYRTLSRPSEYLWIGYASTDADGKEMKPSLVLTKIKKIFPTLVESKDIVSRQDPMDMISNSGAALRHLAEELRNGFEAGQPLDEWKAAYQWFFRNAGNSEKDDPLRISERLRVIREGLTFDNRVERLRWEFVRELYGRGESMDIKVSPSRIERFSKCPFSYYIDFGLRAEERRTFEIAGREIGDICHECLMKLGNALTEEGVGITSPDSLWMTISQEDCDNLVDRLLEESVEGYREGVFMVGEAERYRRTRIRRICSRTAWALISHVRQGNISRMFFEARFGKDQKDDFPAIQVATDQGIVHIEGKIDRIDVLGGNEPSLKIIDYKSGNERFNIDEAKGGWRLQLMLYLKAAEKGLAAKPAGVFYFFIDDPMIEAAIPTGSAEERLKAAGTELAGQIRKKFRMDGILVDEPGILQDIDKNFGGYSEIVPIRKKDDGSITGSESRLLAPEAFSDLQSAVDNTISNLCDRLMKGCIDIAPKRLKNGVSACTYCQYKSICYFDLAFEGCRYENL